MFSRVFFLVLATFLIGDIAAAQVQILDYDRDFATGTTITITGSGFGTKEFPTPWLWDDLSHESYANLQDGDWIPTRNGNSSGFSDTTSNVIDPNALHKESHGWLAYRSNHPQQRIPGRAHYSCEGIYATLFDVGRPHGDTEFIYLDYWVYSTSMRSSGNGADFNKMCRLSPSTESFNTFGHTSFYPGRTSYNAGHDPVDGQLTRRDYSDTLPEEGVWTHVAIWTDGSGNLTWVIDESEGIVKTWVNNQLAVDIDDEGWKNPPIPDDVSGFTFIHALGCESSGAYHGPPEVNLWGDIYVDNTLSRVALGDAPVWTQVSHYEMQIPQEWQPGSIRVTGNLGSFRATDSIWLYVFDAEGVPNETGVLVQTGTDDPEAGPGQPGQPVRM